MGQIVNAPDDDEWTASLPPDHRTGSAFFRRSIAAVGTGLLLVFCTWGLNVLRIKTGFERPYTILYLIPVAIGAAVMGVRGGLVAALLAVLLARLYLFNAPQYGSEPLFGAMHPNQAIEFLSMLAGTLTVALVTGRLRSALSLVRNSRERITQANLKLEDANHRLEETNTRLEDVNVKLLESEEQRRMFHQEVLMAVTGGKLRLVEPNEMPPPDLAFGAPVLTLPLEESMDASRLRRTLQKIAEGLGMNAERIYDLCTSTTEAATNAIKHGSGGRVRVWADAGAVAVEITDRGTGIAPAQLARATLQQGYSTRVSLGMGFHLMLQTSDVLALSTTPQGTSILLRVGTGPRMSEEDALLARYIGL